MAEESAKLRIPYIAAAQAQKHVTHNEAMTLLDTLVQLSVLDKDLSAPPASPGEGNTYIVAPGGTGAWIGWDGRVVRFIDGTWRSYLPGAGGGAGWLAWVMDENAMYRFDGTAWALAGIEGPQGPAPDIDGTSATSLAIGTGSKSFTAQAGIAWTVGQRLRAASAGGPTNFMEGVVTAYSGTSLTLDVDTRGGTGSYADWNIVIAGEPGQSGAVGADGMDPGILLTWDDNNIDSDPGAGDIKAGNDALGSATKLYVSKMSRSGSDIAAFLLALGDSTNPSRKGGLILTRSADGAQATFDIDTVTDATGYVKLDVSGHSGASGFALGDAISFQFSRDGDKGNDGAGSGDVAGPAGATDGRLVLFDGTTGKLIKQHSGAPGALAVLNTVGSSQIDNDAVTYAKMQNVSATDRLLGRDTAGAGDAEELTVGGGVEFTGAGGIQRSALTGDVTASAGSSATTIANDAVSYAKMQNVSAASRLLGRKTAGAGDTEECTLSEALDFIGSAARGDILTRGASAWQRLAKGAANTLLASDGTDPNWAALSYAMIASAAIASAAEFRGATASKLLNAANVWSAADFVALTDGASIALDLATGINFSVALGGNRTLSNPANTKNGQSGVVKLTATTSTRTLTLSANYKPATGVETFPISIATTDNVYLVYHVESSTVIWVTAVLRR